jgi:hypothetical protein
MSDDLNQTVFECRYSFGTAVCDVFVDCRPTINSGPVYVARGYVADGVLLRRVLNDHGNELEVTSATAEDAAERWAAHVEKRFGTIIAGPESQPEFHGPRRIV